MVEVELYGIRSDDGHHTQWYNERFRAEYGNGGRPVITQRVNLPFKPTSASKELAHRIAGDRQHPEWSVDEALCEPAFVSGSVYGQLAQSLLTWGKGGVYNSSTNTRHAHFRFTSEGPSEYYAAVNEQGQFVIKKQVGRYDPWRRGRKPPTQVTVRNYEVQDATESLRNE